MTDFKLTEEQIDALDAFDTKESLIIEACAGAGKTSTLKEMAEGTGRKGLYLAYNKAIQLDAEGRFPSSCRCKTAHSLAFGAIGRNYSHRLNSPRMPASQTAHILGIKEGLEVSKDLFINNFALARLVMDTVTRFCYSADPEPNANNVPHVNGLELSPDFWAIKDMIAEMAKTAWKDITKIDGALKFQHDHYLKMWALSDPKISADYILLDEAQDANPAIEGVVNSQDAQVVMVGDSCQQIYCQPEGTNVETPEGTKKIEDLKIGDKVVAYKDRRVFLKGREISHINRFKYEGYLWQVELEDGSTSRYTDKHHCIVRLGEGLRGKHVVYMMRRGDNYRIGRVPFIYESQNGCFGPKLRAIQEKADDLWILSIHDTKREACLEEALIWTRHSIPGMRFEPSKRDIIDVDEFWSALGSNKEAAENCLEEYGRMIDFPLVSNYQKTKIGLRTPLVTAACNLIPGMLMLAIDKTIPADRKSERKAPIQCWQPIVEIDYIEYNDAVISLEVEDCHTYFGDGILTHNSWRGAEDAMLRFEAANRCTLSQSFRFGPAVAGEANKWLSLLESEIKIKGFDQIESIVQPVEDPDAILCRTNAEAMVNALEAQEKEKKVAIVGGTNELRYFAESAADLKDGKRTNHPDLTMFKDWMTVLQYVNEDSGGKDLKVLVNIIDIYGTEKVIQVANTCVDEKYADVVISTAHKAKGREWDKVRIAEDFREPEPLPDGSKGKLNRSELMLAYVSVTRAKKELDVGSLAWVNDRLPETM